jgi:hypothetical protein
MARGFHPPVKRATTGSRAGPTRRMPGAIIPCLAVTRHKDAPVPRYDRFIRQSRCSVDVAESARERRFAQRPTVCILRLVRERRSSPSVPNAQVGHRRWTSRRYTVIV